jgi:hypothetical protein
MRNMPGTIGSMRLNRQKNRTGMAAIECFKRAARN